MKLRFYLFLFTALFALPLLMQAQAISVHGYIWYFGDYAGVTWNNTATNGDPMYLMDGYLSTNEGCATICDENDNLLCYSDGQKVWNQNHQVMSNSLPSSPGGSLTGSASSTQSALIIPKPNDPSTLYIFTVDANIGPDGLAYSRIDMTANGGLGDISLYEKNISLIYTSTEKITAVMHANGVDIWVIGHAWNSNQFLAFLVTATGIDVANPISSNTGAVHTGYSGSSRGYLTASPAGDMLALGNEGLQIYELFAFDNATGQISHIATFDDPSIDDCYGVEFSPSGQFLYGSERWGNDIHQWDVSLGTDSLIIASHQLVATLGTSAGGALQLAVDNKIYIARNGTDYLGRINNPNLAGTSCNYVDQAVLLGPDVASARDSNEGLPSFLKVGGVIPSVTAAFSATNTQVLTGDTVLFIDSSTGIITNWLWDFGDGAVSADQHPIHIYQNPGIYTVTLMVSNLNSIDTLLMVNYIEVLESLDIEFEANKTQAQAGELVLFTDLSSGNPTNWFWEFGDGGTSSMQNPNHAYSSPGTYSVSLIAWNTYDTATITYTDYIGVLPPGWNQFITYNNHIILIPSFASIDINGNPIEVGDYIGVFYDSLGTMACGGYGVWNGNSSSVAAWIDEATTPEIEGFQVGDVFIWKIYDMSAGMEYPVTATYDMALPNQESFAVHGMSVIESLSTISITAQNIGLPLGWSYFSIFIDPFVANIDSLCSAISSEVSIAKNDVGGTYWPQFNINQIGNIEIGEGYQIKMNSAQTMEVTGLAISPETTPIIIDMGWSLIGYLRNNPAPIQTMLSPIVSQISIVKTGQGAVYWPQWDVDNIGTMHPGKGYQVNMYSTQTLTYPANTINYSKAISQVQLPKHFSTPETTGNNMTLGIPTANLEHGSEIGVFSQRGVLVGAAVVENSFTSISLWGDDETTPEIDGLLDGEEFQIRVFKGEEYDLHINSWMQGDGFYGSNKIAVASEVSNFQFSASNFQLNQNVPNPFTN